MLNLQRPLAVIDLETTGTFSGIDRIVDIGIVTREPSGHLTEWQSLVNPEMPIPPSSTAIHGITDEMVRGAPTLAQLADEIHERLADVDVGGFNVKRFDWPFLETEMRRVGRPFAESNRLIIDSQRVFHACFPRTLEVAVREYLGRDHDGAHRAAADAKATLLVLEEQVKRHGLPETPAELVDSLRDPNAIDDDGKFVWREEWPCITFGKHRGHSLQWLKKNEPGFLDWITKNDFSSEVKRIARDAFMGVFPKKVSA